MFLHKTVASQKVLYLFLASEKRLEGQDGWRYGNSDKNDAWKNSLTRKKKKR